MVAKHGKRHCQCFVVQGLSRVLVDQLDDCTSCLPSVSQKSLLERFFHQGEWSFRV